MRLMARADATSQVWNGNVAEWWYTDSNVLASFGSGNIAGLTQLATRGPFAFPHIAQNIIEYRSLRTLPNLPANTRIGTEYYSSKYVTPTWTVGSATNLAYNAHPSLPSNYQQFKPRVASPLFSYAAQPGVASGGVGTAYVSGMAGMGRLMTS
jgi:hypothetical protein